MAELDCPEGAITFLPTVDLEATTRFYRDGLRLPMVLDQHTCRIFRISKESFVGFCSHTGTVPEPASSVIVTLLVADVPAWYARCQSEGLETDGEARINERFAIEHFFIRDPNGYRVEIQRFLDPDWQRRSNP